MTKTKSNDRLWIGITLGFVLPLLIFYLYYLLKFNDIEFISYLLAMHEYRLLFKVMSLCVLTDLPLFYLFLQLKWMKAARGVVMSCFSFAFMVLGYRIFNR